MLDLYFTETQRRISEPSDKITPEIIESFIINVLYHSGVRRKEAILFPDFSINDNTGLFEPYYKRMQPLLTLHNLEDRLQSIPPPKVYERKPFPINRPVFEDIEKEVMKEAIKSTKTIKFWKWPSLRDDYVGKNTYPRYKQLREDWEQAKELFDAGESDLEQAFNKKERDRYEFARQVIYEESLAFISPSLELIERRIHEAISAVRLPFSLSIAYTMKGDAIYLDALYPHRNKLMGYAEDNYRYLTALLGSAYVLASHLFNLGNPVKSIIIVGHAPSIAAYRDIDETLFAVHFDRETFESDFSSLKDFDPFDTLFKYTHLLNVSSSRYVLYPVKVNWSWSSIRAELDNNELQYDFAIIKASKD